MSILHAVSPGNIESELSKIWESLEGLNKTRACLFNLVFYAENDARLSYIRKVADNIVEKFPARILMIIADKTSQKSFLTVNVSVMAMGKEKSDVACDLIQIEVSKDQISKVPFVILPHIVPDLPIYLIWSADFTSKDPILTELEAFATRLIVDSEASESFSLFAKTCLSKQKQSLIEIADLNWARTETWRNLISSFFYPQDKLNALKQSKQIQITYNAAESFFFSHTTIQALYIQAWLASQLKWTPKKATKKDEMQVFTYENEQGDVEILLTPCRHDNFNPGMVVSVDITTTQNLHFSFYRTIDYPHQITLITSTSDRCDIPCHFIFAKSELGMSLAREICHKGTSLHFLNALQLLC